MERNKRREREPREGLFRKFFGISFGLFLGPFENHSVVFLDLSCEVHIVKSVHEYYKHLSGYVMNGIRFLVDDDHFFLSFMRVAHAFFLRLI